MMLLPRLDFHIRLQRATNTASIDYCTVLRFTTTLNICAEDLSPFFDGVLV